MSSRTANLLLAAAALIWPACSFHGEQLPVPFLTGEIHVHRATPVLADGVDNARVYVIVYDSLEHRLADYPARLEWEAGGTQGITSPLPATDDYGYSGASVTSTTVGPATLIAFIEVTPSSWMQLPDRATIEFVGSIDETLSYAPQQVFPTGAQPIDLVVEDFDDDWYLDVVTADWGAGTVSILEGQHDHTLAAPVAQTATPHPRALAAGDFTGDGHLDLVVGDESLTGAWLFSGAGDTTFAQAEILPLTGAAVAFAAEDLTNDYHSELAVASREAHALTVFAAPLHATSTPVGLSDALPGAPHAVWLGQVDYDSPWRVLTTFALPNIVVSYDVDAVGSLTNRVDVNVPGPCGVQNAALMPGPDGGAPRMVVTCLAPPGIRLASESATNQVAWELLLAGHGAGDLAVVDLNDDEHLDLAVTLPDADKVAVLLGNAAGSFATPLLLATGSRPLALAHGDINHDGVEDLVVANYNDATVSLLLSN